MTTAPTGWKEITRTLGESLAGEFDFVDGPARGRHQLAVRWDGSVPHPARYAVMAAADDEGMPEQIYLREGTMERWYFRHVRPVLNPWPHITCPDCGRTTFRPNHLLRGWCPQCRTTTQDGGSDA